MGDTERLLCPGASQGPARFHSHCFHAVACLCLCTHTFVHTHVHTHTHTHTHRTSLLILTTAIPKPVLKPSFLSFIQCSFPVSLMPPFVCITRFLVVHVSNLPPADCSLKQELLFTHLCSKSNLFPLNWQHGVVKACFKESGKTGLKS